MPAAGRKVFTLLVEMRCNSYCVFCGQREVDDALIQSRKRLGLSLPVTKFGATRGRYTLASATAALVRAREEGFSELSLQGGEPTVWPDLVPLVAAARTLGFTQIGMVTNGRRLADEKYAVALASAGLDALTASLLGHDAETHDAIAAAPGAFAGLVEGLRNMARIAAELPRPLTLNVNLITSARSVDHLADQVSLLASLGVGTASIHLVRFSGLASDPGVREPLRFDIRRLVPALASAMAEGERLSVRLHATDVPMCLHPRLAAAELALLERRAAIEEHRFEAAAFGYDHQPRHPTPSACAGCLLDGACARVPPEYLTEPAGEAFSPLTESSVAERVASLLAAIDPTKSAAPARPGSARVDALRDLDRALATVERLASLREAPGKTLAASRARIDEALGKLLVHAFRRRDGAELLAAFHALVGLEPSTRLHLDARAFALIAAWGRLRGTLPVAGGPRLRFAHGLEVALDGRLGEGGEVTFADAALASPDPRGPCDRVLQALFTVFVVAPLRDSRCIRVTDEGIDFDKGCGWCRGWAFARPHAIELVP